MASLLRALETRETRRGMALLLISAFLAAACGTTVPAPVQEELGEVTAGEEGLSVESLPPGAKVNKKGQVISASGEVIGTVDESGNFTSTSSSAPGTTTTGGGAPPVTAPGEWGPGITDSKIYIGQFYDNAGAANQAAFGTPIDGDARKPYSAMAEWVNERGGILGRQVELLYYELKAEQDINQQAQAACSHWTEDNEVFFFFGADANGIMRECAHENGGVMPLPGGSSLPSDFVKYPNYFEVSGLNFYRAGNVTVKGLNNEGYYEDAKLGIVLWDHPDYKAALENGYLPELKKIGVSLHTEPAYISPPQQLQDVAATSADINSAVLRFQSEGVTHVMILGGPTGVCAQGCSEILWFRRAEQQNYRPRYGLNANNIAIAGRDAGLYAEEQLDGMISVEWGDDTDFYDEGWKKNAAREKCFAIMRSKDVPMSNVDEQGNARFACEQFWFALASVGHLDGGALNASAFTAAANQLGWGYQSPSAYAIFINADQHDGTAAARNLMFDGGCDCFKWLSKPYRV